MNCPKCGTILQTNAKYCKRCGTNVESTCKYGDNISKSVYDSSSCHNTQYNYSYSYSNKTKPNYNINASHQEQMDYNYFYSQYNYKPTQTMGDERYIEAYVSENYKSIKNSKFSLGAFFFGGFYYLYRKYWSFAFIYFLATIASTFCLGAYADIFNIFVNIVMALKFNEKYMMYVEQKVDQIKQSNFDKTSTELLEECHKKGGTSMKCAIGIPLIALIIIGIAFIYLVTEGYINMDSDIITTDETTQIDTTNIDTTNYETLNSLTYKLPENTRITNSGPNYKYYIYENNDYTTNCFIRVTSETSDQSAYNNLESKVILQNYSINPITKNNHVWYYLNQDTANSSTTYYSINYENQLYTIETSDYSQTTNTCDEVYTEFLNTVNFN